MGRGNGLPGPLYLGPGHVTHTVRGNKVDVCGDKVQTGDRALDPTHRRQVGASVIGCTVKAGVEQVQQRLLLETGFAAQKCLTP